MREVIQPIFPGYVPWEHQPCHHCGSPGHHLTIHDPPALECINVLREQVAQAKQPITTYAKLSAATGIPIARLERLRMFAPEPEGVVRVGEMANGANEPQTQAEAAIADAATWGQPGRQGAIAMPDTVRDPC